MNEQAQLLVDDKVNSLLRQVVAVQLTLQDIDLALQIIPENAYIWLDNEVNINWPAKDMTEVKELLRQFALRGHLLAEFVESSTAPRWRIKGINTTICLAPTWSTNTEDGATCKLIKVGETTQTYPIYKLVCNGKEVSKDETFVEQPAVEETSEVLS